MILDVWLLVRVCLLARLHVEMYPSRIFPFVVEEGCNDISGGMCVCVCVCVYVCMYVYVCVHVRMNVCTYVCTYVCMYVCMYVYMHLCTYVCV